MLNNGELFWPKTLEKKKYNTVGNIDCDVLVVGGGMSGALSAYRAAEAGYHTVLIDQGEVGCESTSANTGLLQYMSDKSLHECIADFGEEAAYHFYRSSYEGLNDIRALCEVLPDDVQLIDRDSVLYASRKKDNAFLKKEYIALRKLGFPCHLMDGAMLEQKYGIQKSMALVTHEDAEINPFVFVQRLLERAVNEFGLEISEYTELKKWKTRGNRVHCELSGLRFAVADHVVYAGGYADNAFVKKITKKKFVRSFAIVTKPVEHQWKERAMIWETAVPYLYMRHVQGNRIIVGGLDDATKKVPSRRLIQKKGKQLKKEFEQLFPNLPIEIEEAYGARFGETKDGLPFIGRAPGQHNIYMLLGYGGNGTVYSSFGSKAILRMIQGEINEQDMIFDPSR